MNCIYSISSVCIFNISTRYYARRKIMTKKVRYNGGTWCYSYSSRPDKLIENKEYEVIITRTMPYQTNFVLKDVEGEFCADWFDDISSDDNVYMAFSQYQPVIGEKYDLEKMVIVINGKQGFTRHTTSPVKFLTRKGEFSFSYYYSKRITKPI